MTKKELALEYHKKGYNCTQAVACAFCGEFGVSEEEMYKIAEGFGLGMGMMDTCGALTGLFMLIGMKNSGGVEQAGKTKAGTKMLAPMFLMLGVVLVIIVVPAFFSVQI